VSPPRLSLILATVGRVDEPARFLASLLEQGPPDWELVLVDQNPDERLAPLVESWTARLPLKHLRAPRGLSRARNAGLAAATGELLAFPDDDCWYPPGLLPRVATRLEAAPELTGLCIRGVDPAGRSLLSGSPETPGPVRRLKVWRQGISIGLFLRRGPVAALGGFDERLGAGAGTPWGSGEESDLLLRLLEAGGHLYYDPSMQVIHPAPSSLADPAALARARAYGRGMGEVLRRHRLPRRFIAWQLLRALGGALLAALRGRGTARLYLAALRGRWEGVRGRLA